MAKKHKCACPAGVPEWIVTFGDLMSLLLTFFVLLVSLSEIKKETPKYQKTVKAIQKQFGMDGRSGMVPTDDVPFSDIEVMEHMAHNQKIRQTSSSEDPGLSGRDTTIQKIREGLQFTVGGLITFEPGSAELKDQAKEQLAKLAGILRGKNNKIEVRGHATGLDLTEDSPFRSLTDLSYARAKAVAAYLAEPTQGIREKRMRIVAAGAHEPLVGRRYDQAALQVNRRVEIIVSEALVEEFEAPTGDERGE